MIPTTEQAMKILLALIAIGILGLSWSLIMSTTSLPGIARALFTFTIGAMVLLVFVLLWDSLK